MSNTIILYDYGPFGNKIMEAEAKATNDLFQRNTFGFNEKEFC